MSAMLVSCTNHESIKTKQSMTTPPLTQEWDKVFPLSEKVNQQKVTFMTQYGLTLAADLYTPASPDIIYRLAPLVTGSFLNILMISQVLEP